MISSLLGMRSAGSQEIELSTDPAMAKARELILNIRRRNLYRSVFRASLQSFPLMFPRAPSNFKAVKSLLLPPDRFVDEFILPSELSPLIPKVTPELIAPNNPMAVDLRPEHIIVHDHVLNYGSKVLHALTCSPASCSYFPRTLSVQDKNPVDATRFFREYTSTESFNIPKHKVSYILPNQV